MPGWGAAGHAVPAVQALTDCLVLSLLHEPQHTYATFSMLPLISRLEVSYTILPRKGHGTESDTTPILGLITSL